MESAATWAASAEVVARRHEQGAASMADVHGRPTRPTRRVAVAMATLGPGATNLVTGVADAYLDRAPMVALTAQAGSDRARSGRACPVGAHGAPLRGRDRLEGRTVHEAAQVTFGTCGPTLWGATVTVCEGSM